MFSTDAATDAILHFIGLFHLADLQARLRLDYDRLAATPLVVEVGPIATLDLDIPNPYMPRDFGPQLRYVPPLPGLDDVDNGARHAYLDVRAPLPADQPDPGALPTITDIRADLPQPAPGPGPFAPDWHLPPPGSVAVVIIQHSYLDDNDQLNADDVAGAVAQNVLAAHLDGLEQLAASLGVAPGLQLPSSEADFHDMALRLGEAIAAGGPAGVPGADIIAVAGAEAFGSHLNGIADGTLPGMDDLMPVGWSDAHARGGGFDADGPAHYIVHGANILLNEVSITASWISAPVLVVAGASYSFDLISQVNIWQDMDSINGLWDGLAGGTQGFNYASLIHASAPLPVVADGDGGAPVFWITTTIEGSLINFNWIEQHNFVSDNDITSITLQGMETTLIFGANQAVNQVSLLELGSYFDLIIVDGHMINLSAILQTNVLLDSDHVTLRDGASLSSGDNLLVNDASIYQLGQAHHLSAAGGFAALLANGSGDLPRDVLHDPAFAGHEVLRVLHIKGDLVSAQIIEQLNVLGDADQVDLLAARAMANAGDASVVTGSNVLINSAHVAQFGVNSTVHTGGGVYSDALIHQAQLVDSDNPFAAAGGLASEAVVFLADGMAGTGLAAELDGGSHHAGPGASELYSPDPMHTVVV